MLRRLYHEQPASFAFTPANQRWAEAQIAKFPEGRQASAIIPLLWRAQEQEGWLSRAAIEHVCEMLDMAYIRGLEVATFYFMFQLQPVGTVAHFQICGTTTCMICGAEDLIEVCKQKIAPKAHQLSADGRFSWEEVECLGACANAPMAQIGKDYYEDLTPDGLSKLIDEMAAGHVPAPGSEIGRFSSEPKGGPTSLTEYSGRMERNASVDLAVAIGDTLKRIDGTEVPLRAPWLGEAGGDVPPEDDASVEVPLDLSRGAPINKTGVTRGEAPVNGDARVDTSPTAKADQPDPHPIAEDGGAPRPVAMTEPARLQSAREGAPDDLKKIKGVGPKLEALLHRLGFYHFDQIAGWTEAETAWVDENLEGFKGRVTRDDWVAQAKTLASGGETEFSKRVDEGEVY